MPKKITLTIDYGYDIHSIEVDADEWRKACDGLETHFDGQGFAVEGDEEQDYWSIYRGAEVEVQVLTDSGRDIFNGGLDEVIV